MEKPTTGPPGVAAPAITAGSTPAHPLFRPHPPGVHLRRSSGCSVSRADHPERDPRHDSDKIHAAFAQRIGQDRPAAPQRDKSDGRDRTPQDDVDDQGGAHGGAPVGYIRTYTKRPSAPARTGSGSERI